MRILPHGWRLVGVAIAMPWLLSACGNGSEPSPTELRASADSLNLGGGQTASVLDNDRVGDQAASLANASVSLSGNLPTGVSFADGVFSVRRGTAGGSYRIDYRLCERAQPSNCASASVDLRIPTPALLAGADSLALAAGGSASLLGNDSLDGEPASAPQVSAEPVGTWPSGVSLAADGRLSVGTQAAAGELLLDYRLCLGSAASQCGAAARVTLTVGRAALVSGRVLSASTGQAAAGVTVRLGAANVQTDTEGRFQLPAGAANERALLQLAGGGYGETTRVLRVGADGLSDLQVRLLPASQNGQVDAATGGSVGSSDGRARVTLAAGSLQRADGTPASGPVAVQLTAINPAVDSSLMPGDYSTLVSGVERQIESFGALAVELRDSAGQALNLRPGQTATLRIPLGTRSAQPPSTVPLFFFDEGSGRWVQEGSATLQGSGALRYYEGTVSHFSIWNADQLIETVYLQGCVVDASGQRVARAWVSSDGIDYSGSSGAYSDASGSFRLALRRNSLSTMTATLAGLLSNTARVTTGASDLTQSDCLVLSASATGVTITLTWGEKPSDLDSHLYAPDGSHVYFRDPGSLAAAPFANLDVDDISSFGPEVITLTRLMVGTYRYAVHNYSGYGDGPISSSQAQVTLRLPGRAPELFLPPASGESVPTSYWTVFELDVDAQCQVTLRRVGRYEQTSTPAPAATARYCSGG